MATRTTKRRIGRRTQRRTDENAQRRGDIQRRARSTGRRTAADGAKRRGGAKTAVKGGRDLKVYDVKAVARVLDLTERRVRQLKEQGIIQEYKGMPGLYELIPTVHAYVNYLRNRNPESAENIDYNTERAKLVRAKRLNEEYDLRVKEGDLHASADIETVMSNMLINFKSRLAAIPAKLSPILSKKTDKAEIHRILKDSVDEALNELADFNNTFNEGAGGESENGNT
jgi:hypothetical protein